jgi:hypothetical protein
MGSRITCALCGSPTPSASRTPGPSPNPVTREMTTAHRHPEMPGQGHKAGRTVGITAPTGPVRGLFRPRPWAGPCPSVDCTAPGTRRPRTHSGRRRREITPRSASVLVSRGWLGRNERAVKPSAQPTLVRTQHLPHISAVQSRWHRTVSPAFASQRERFRRPSARSARIHLLTVLHVPRGLRSGGCRGRQAAAGLPGLGVPPRAGR